VAGHRFFAAIYDRLMASTEEAGLEEKRHELVGQARGRTLELGAGTGLNLAHYPPEVSELVLAEPDPHMAKRLREKVAEQAGRPIEVISAAAEQLPFDDASFDTVVGTLVLCTVDRPAKALSEARRVLAPEGRLLFIEHVRSEQPRLSRWQDRLERPWGWFAGGCHPNRDTGGSIAAAGFTIEQLDQGELPKAPPLARPLISGRAVRPSGQGT
jgi:ubiquinone/menaquinone biosynthesis C-methylase UbiE